MVVTRNIMACPVLTAAALLAGCAGGADRYPSLAIRDVERVQGSFSPVAPADTILTPSPAPAGQQDTLAALVAQADAAHRDFLAAASGTRDRVSAVSLADPDSNDWARAQVALADLDSHRSRAAIALGDLDLLYAEASTGFSERKAIDAAREHVIAMIAEEDRVLAELRERANP